MTTDDSSITASQEPTNAPGRAEMPVEGRAGADVASGSNAFISWGVRSDVGLVRSHNEDSFLLRTPLFAVCDGMATVYRGLDEVLGRAVAIKTMLPQYATDPSFAARFKQEAQAAAALQSPYIVSVYDWGKDGDTYYIIMT